MATLSIIERLDAQIAALVSERQRIKTQADADVATVAARIQILRDAKAAITPAVETAYTALKAAGFIKET